MPGHVIILNQLYITLNSQLIIDLGSAQLATIQILMLVVTTAIYATQLICIMLWSEFLGDRFLSCLTFAWNFTAAT